MNQKVAIRMLEKRGHKVVISTNGRDALSVLENREFDLVLMDVQMPELDGVGTTKLLRERETITGRRQAVVAMTALAMKGDRERCLAAGMDGYLSKPIRQNQLDEVLDAIKKDERRNPTVTEELLPQDAVIVVEQLLETSGGDMVFLSELLELLRVTYPEQIVNAAEAIRNCDPVALESAGHALRGILGNFAAPAAMRMAGQLEEMGQSRNLGMASITLQELEEEVVRVMEAVDAVCTGSPQ